MLSTNEHYIPRFLLRGFASSTRRRETYTFLFRRSLEPTETNIKRVGGEFDFYTGMADRNADSVLKPVETELATFVAHLRRATEEMQVRDTIIPELVVHVMLRNKCLRQAMLRLVQKFTAIIKARIQTPEALSRLLKTAISQKPAEFVAAFEAAARRANTDPQWSLHVLDHVIRNPSALSALSTSAEVDKYFGNLNEFLSECFPDLLKSSHVEGLLNVTLPKQWVEAVEDWNWFLVIRDKGTFILGDVGPLFKVLKSTQYRSLPSGLYEFDFGYLPISDTHLLLGFAEGMPRVLNVEELNRAICACSSEFFVSSRITHRELTYLEVLGSNVDLIPDQELDPVLDRIFAPAESS